MTPHDTRAAQLRELELKAANAVFEKNPQYFGVQAHIDDRETELKKSLTEEKRQLRTEARMQHLLNYIDIRGEGYGQLVVDLESFKALDTHLRQLVNFIFYQFSGLEIEILLPIGPGAEEPPLHASANRIGTRARHWRTEALKRLAALNETRGSTETAMDADKPPDKPELLSGRETVNRKQAAEALGISERQFDRHVKDKHLTPTGLTAHKRFKTKELLKFLTAKNYREE